MTPGLGTLRIVRRQPRCPPLPQLPPLLARVYAHRGVATVEDLDDRLAGLHHYRDLLGIEAAVERLLWALRRRETVLVVGDFDADGATATAVAVRALRALGARVAYLVPDRFRDGYGLSPGIVERAARRHAPGLILTVDNGIASLAGVERARALGIDVIVTDHHLPGERLPAACAIVNPNQPGDPFPSKHLAGVGVVFYLLTALRAALREAGAFRHRPEPRLAALLDLVALGTVADVVPLDRNNRILVSQGLKRIRAGGGNPGILALMEVAGRDPHRARAADLGFAVGPRPHTAGRPQDTGLGIACLLAPDLAAARPLAARLDQLNRQRQAVEEAMQADAEAQLTRLQLTADRLPWGVCLYDPRWHQGIVGILAGRLRERLQRPVICFAPGEDGQIKGSARSVPGLHIRDVLDAVATAHPELLSKFGGHAMAAGLSLEASRLEAFQAAFDVEVRRRLGSSAGCGVLESDGPVAPTELDLANAEALRQGGPWGPQFPEPLFDDRFQVCSRRVLGDRHLKLRLRHLAGGAPVEAICFRYLDRHPAEVAPEGSIVHAAFQLDVNDYRGLRSPQLLLRQLLPA